MVFMSCYFKKEFAVDISIPEQKIFVQGDTESINRILNNLLSNAIRYGSDGKYIGFFLREDKRYVYIDVADKGKGLEKSLQPVYLKGSIQWRIPVTVRYRVMD